MATVLSFDGKSINFDDKYRARMATFTSDFFAAEYGPLFAAAPELWACLNAVRVRLKFGGSLSGNDAKEFLPRLDEVLALGSPAFAAKKEVS